MPKRFNGFNNKAVLAREKKAADKQARESQILKEIEDKYWQENDKNILKKQKRKEEKKQKRQDLLNKKAEKKALFENEIIKYDKQKNTHKITRAEIDNNIISNKTIKLEINQLTKEIPIFENVNKTSLLEENAHNVTDALKIFEDNYNEVDKHPEKRRKAAYISYEQYRLEALKKTHPTLRLSQLKQVIFKEWQKAEENPKNKIA